MAIETGSGQQGDTFIVQGGAQLHGELIPQGAKNETLQIISAVLLTEEEVEITNIPEITDVLALISLIESMGVEVKRLGEGHMRFRAKNINLEYLSSEAYLTKGGALRGSVMLMGPLLGRFGQAVIPKPGGDKIGRRRLDTHFLGFAALGAEFRYESDTQLFYTEAPNGLKGSSMLLDEASVTGTANILMAAVLAEGTTQIYFAACEPYIQQLSRMLNRMGARIEGVGSNLLTVHGVGHLNGTTHEMLPDMIEVGSFIGLAAMTGSDIRIKCCGVPHLGPIPRVFQQLGIDLRIEGDDIYVPAQAHYEVETFMDGGLLTISDAPWPGFTPDLLSIVLVVATQARGSVLIHQKMFESRLFFTDKLIDMGAQIILCDPHRATVIGLDKRSPLRGIRMTSPDIRAGVSLLIAALSAKGTSTIFNVSQIDRGYQRIQERLNALGAKIERV